MTPDEAFEIFRRKVIADEYEAMNRAAAAIMFGKTPDMVSAADMAAAQAADYIVVGNRPLCYRARRAAHVAAFKVLSEYGLLPVAVTKYIITVFGRLDAGYVFGYANPVPVDHRREGDAWLDQVAETIADEVSYTIGLYGMNWGAALTQVTGIKRPDAKREPPTEVAIPLRKGRQRRADGGEDHGQWNQARRLLARGEDLLGELDMRYAQSQGEHVRLRDGLEDPHYMAERDGRLLLLKESQTRAWLLSKAGKPGLIP